MSAPNRSRTASRFDPDRGKATTWVLTTTHRRAVDRVRSAQAAADRDERVAALGVVTPFDEVVEEVTERLEQRKVRRCLKFLTELQRESVVLAYYRATAIRRWPDCSAFRWARSGPGCVTG